MNLTATEVQDIKWALENTWQAIGSDIMEMTDGDSISRSTLIEMVLDADRTEMYGNLGADILAKFKELSYKEKIKIAEMQFPYLSYS